jgi:hypothetical protein
MGVAFYKNSRREQHVLSMGGQGGLNLLVSSR